MTKRTIVLVCLCLGSRAQCPKPWKPYGDRCYYATTTQHTFVKCQTRVCEKRGGSLAKVTNEDLSKFLRELVMSGIRGHARIAPSGMAFIGLWERLPEKEGDWRWVGNSARRLGSNFSYWHSDQPDGRCGNEHCAAINLRYESRNWFDVSCASRYYCTCELGLVASSDYKSHEVGLATNDTADYSQCPVTPGHECFWQANVVYKILYTLGVLPCLVVAASILLSMCCNAEQGTEIISWPVPSEDDWSVSSSSYGFLVGDSDSATDVSEIVHRSIMRGAFISILYAFIPLGFAVARMTGASLSFHFDCGKAFAMCLCKLVVGMSALSVHRHLSPVSKAISGQWILAFAFSKVLMSLCAMGLAIVYFVVSLHHAGMATLCVVRFILSCVILAHLCLQCAAGFALFRIQRCASAVVGDPWVFSSVMRCWWNMLITATLGVGIGVWGRGLTFVFDMQVESLPFIMVEVAAVCELLAGMSMLLANVRIRAYFRTHISDKHLPGVSEMAIGARNDASSCHAYTEGCEEL